MGADACPSTFCKEMRWPHFAILAAAMLAAGVIGFFAGVFAGAKKTSQKANQSAEAAINFVESARSTTDLQYSMLIADQLDLPPGEAVQQVRDIVSLHIEGIVEYAGKAPEMNSMTSNSEIEAARETVKHLRNQQAEQVEDADAE
jgi:alpha-D-ribose 1-methylphosphonate 5-triphosphate diphosphatase PhnM